MHIDNVSTGGTAINVVSTNLTEKFHFHNNKAKNLWSNLH